MMYIILLVSRYLIWPEAAVQKYCLWVYFSHYESCNTEISLDSSRVAGNTAASGARTVFDS